MPIQSYNILFKHHPCNGMLSYQIRVHPDIDKQCPMKVYFFGRCLQAYYSHGTLTPIECKVLIWRSAMHPLHLICTQQHFSDHFALQKLDLTYIIYVILDPLFIWTYTCFYCDTRRGGKNLCLVLTRQILQTSNNIKTYLFHNV